MTQVVTINMSMEEFRALLLETQREAYNAGRESAVGQRLPDSDFRINPETTYPVDDVRIARLFGLEGTKQLTSNVNRFLRKYDVDPIRQGKKPSLVFGSDILKILSRLRESNQVRTDKTN